MPELLPQNILLNNKGVDDEGVGEGRPGMIFDEDHEETETNEHHDVDILIHGIIGFVVIVADVGVDLDEDSIEHNQDNLNDDGMDSKDDLVPLL